MVFPIIPIAAIIALLGGAGTLTWYFTSSPQEREESDRKANEIALRLYNKTLDKLSKPEAKKVIEQVRRES